MFRIVKSTSKKERKKSEIKSELIFHKYSIIGILSENSEQEWHLGC